MCYTNNLIIYLKRFDVRFRLKALIRRFIAFDTVFLKRHLFATFRGCGFKTVRKSGNVGHAKLLKYQFFDKITF
jgi:hypothetical protein